MGAIWDKHIKDQQQKTFTKNGYDYQKQINYLKAWHRFFLLLGIDLSKKIKRQIFVNTNISVSLSIL